LSASGTMFSFADLSEEIDGFVERATKDKESWRRLRKVADGVAAKAPATSLLFLNGKVWSLLEVSITGFRGISNSDPLTIQFDPSPGVTVIHGPNGAGKSSISDAIESGLSGRPSFAEARSGTGGSAPLWEPVHLGRDAKHSVVSLLLGAGESRLALTRTLKSEQSEGVWVCQLTHDGKTSTVDLGVSWNDAILSHQPVFAYATLERRVQVAKDLAEYFETLLAFGGAFGALELEVTSRGADSAAALSRWKASRDEVFVELDEIDARFTRPGYSELDAVKLPDVSDVVATWVSGNGLNLSGEALAELPAGLVGEIAEEAAALQETIDRLQASNSSILDELAVSLESLHEDALEVVHESSTCPVCGSDQPLWMTALKSTVERLASRSEARDAFIEHLEQFELSGLTYLESVHGASAVLDDSSNLGIVRAECRALLDAFEAALANHGVQPHSEVVSVAKSLVEWARSSPASELIEFAISQSDYMRQWAVSRTSAVDGFVAIWKKERAQAMSAADWAATSKRIDDLKSYLRKKRVTELELRASSRVQELLADVGLSIGALNVLKTKASMELTDSNGQRLELGMLSAGQRNAVLLAPLLASVDAGPFGFVVLDDPVHAFDEMRIDRLAESISSLAAKRRVIVLTHDERLREHLLARVAQCEVMSISRSLADGTVSVATSTHSWSQLLLDARAILSMKPVDQIPISVTDAVRGLCRQAVDNAVREFVIRNAVTRGQSVDAAISELDDRMTTNERLAFAETRWDDAAGTNPATSAKGLCEPHMQGWNRATHGNPPISEAALEEIDAAERACLSLMVAA
jgi:ABC-type uncharacterized transport system ATPase subunit